MQIVRARPPTLCVHRAKAAREAGGSALQVVPIFAALPPEQQARVFEPAPDGARKVLLNFFRTGAYRSAATYPCQGLLCNMRGSLVSDVLAEQQEVHLYRIQR